MQAMKQGKHAPPHEPTKSRHMEQQEQEHAEQGEGIAIKQMDVDMRIGRQQLQTQVDDFLGALEGHDGAAKRQGQVKRQETAGAGTESGGAEALEPAEVNFAAMIGAGQNIGQPPIGLDQRVAAEELAGAAQVRQFQLIARQGVAQVAHRQVAVVDNAVEQLLNQLVECDLLGQILRTER